MRDKARWRSLISACDAPLFRLRTELIERYEWMGVTHKANKYRLEKIFLQRLLRIDNARCHDSDIQGSERRAGDTSKERVCQSHHTVVVGSWIHPASRPTSSWCPGDCVTAWQVKRVRVCPTLIYKIKYWHRAPGNKGMAERVVCMKLWFKSLRRHPEFSSPTGACTLETAKTADQACLPLLSPSHSFFVRFHTLTTPVPMLRFEITMRSSPYRSPTCDILGIWDVLQLRPHGTRWGM